MDAEHAEHITGDRARRFVDDGYLVVPDLVEVDLVRPLRMEGLRRAWPWRVRPAGKAALLDAGADIDADGAVLTGGTPLSDAVIFGQWNAARLLVHRGAAMTLWQAAAMGETDALAAIIDETAPGSGELANACWHACRAGRLDTAQQLVALGADLDWLGHDELTSRQAGLASGAEDLVAWLTAR